MPAKLTTAQFIAKSIEIHGNRYNYELVEYKNTKSKIKIICREHGEFLQTPDHHYKGHGCPSCGGIASNKERVATAKSEFKTRADLIHNSKYSYELVDYKTALTKVSITCLIHGEFLQRPSDHLKGQGCPICGNIAKSENAGWSRTAFADKCEKNNNGLGILYILECFNDTEKFYKIGITSNSVKKRYSCTRDMPYLYSIVKEVIGDPVEIYNLETKLHQINKLNHYVPSIPFAGSVSECFIKYKEN